MAKRALSIKNIIDYNPKTLGFTGRWLATMGDPEPYGSWIIHGGSGNGNDKYLFNFEIGLIKRKERKKKTNIRVKDKVERGLLRP